MDMAIDQVNRYELNSFVEAFTIINKLLDSKTNLGLTQLSNGIRCSKNKTFRLLTNLEYFGFVEKDPQCRYTIGVAAHEMARKITSKNTSVDCIRPYLKDVTDLINESTYYANIVEKELLLVGFADCSRLVRVASLVGKSVKFPSVSADSAQSKSLDVIGDIMLTTEGFGPDVTAVIAPIDCRVGTGQGAFVVVAPTCRMQIERIKTEIVPALRAVMQLHLLSDLKKMNTVVTHRMPVAFDAFMANIA